MSEAFSATIVTGAFICPVTVVGNTLASTTLKLLKP